MSVRDTVLAVGAKLGTWSGVRWAILAILGVLTVLSCLHAMRMIPYGISSALVTKSPHMPVEEILPTPVTWGTWEQTKFETDVPRHLPPGTYAARTGVTIWPGYVFTVQQVRPPEDTWLRGMPTHLIDARPRPGYWAVATMLSMLGVSLVYWAVCHAIARGRAIVGRRLSPGEGDDSPISRT